MEIHRSPTIAAIFSRTISQRPSVLISFMASYRFEADQARLYLHLLPEADEPVRVSGEIRGFGFPNYQIQGSAWVEPGPSPKLVYRLREKGFFAELDARVDVRVDVSRIQDVQVGVMNGDIVVHANGLAPERLPRLELNAGQGRVIQR